MFAHTHNAPVEILFSFDTTGSMSSCIGEVRREVTNITDKLFSSIAHVRIAVLAHGDYCDKHNYITKWHDFVGNNDAHKLHDFVQNVSYTGGGDSPECYELVLRQAHTEIAWTPGSQRALVMIGDADPHTPEDALRQGGEAIDWRAELLMLRQMGVRVYGVECSTGLFGGYSSKFWEELARAGGGRHLKLQNFPTIVDMFMAICFREIGAEHFDAYEQEVRLREGAGIRTELSSMFDALRDTDTSTSDKSDDSGYISPPMAPIGPMTPVPTGMAPSHFSPMHPGIAPDQSIFPLLPMVPNTAGMGFSLFSSPLPAVSAPSLFPQPPMFPTTVASSAFSLLASGPVPLLPSPLPSKSTVDKPNKAHPATPKRTSHGTGLTPRAQRQFKRWSVVDGMVLRSNRSLGGQPLVVRSRRRTVTVVDGMVLRSNKVVVGRRSIMKRSRRSSTSSSASVRSAGSDDSMDMELRSGTVIVY